MKRKLVFFLAVMLLLSAFSACSRKIIPSEPIAPAELYFLCSEVEYGSENGVLGVQTVDLGQTDPDLATFLEQYLKTVPAEGLDSPFPKNLRVLSAKLTNDIASVQLGGSYAELSGIQSTLADACLARTVLARTNADKMLLTVSDSAGTTVRTKKIGESDLLMYDDSSDISTTAVTLFFTDEHTRYLIAERRTLPYIPAAELPKQLIAMLIAGPETTGLQKTLPKGTRLLDINVDGGICAVDFSADFLNNSPKTVSEERMALLSVVNTLTELDTIDQVQFYVEGRRQELFSFLSLSGIFVSDSVATGPVRTDLNEFDATVYLPTVDSGLLYAIPARLKAGSDAAADAVLRFLADYDPKNGVLNPLFGKPLPERVRIDKGCCTVEYPAQTVFGENAAEELQAVRSLTASLTALDDVRSVRILIGDVPSAFTYNELPEKLTPSALWYCS